MGATSGEHCMVVLCFAWPLLAIEIIRTYRTPYNFTKNWISQFFCERWVLSILNVPIIFDQYRVSQSWMFPQTQHRRHQSRAAVEFGGWSELGGVQHDRLVCYYRQVMHGVRFLHHIQVFPIVCHFSGSWLRRIAEIHKFVKWAAEAYDALMISDVISTMC
jgi:hypothetical protein